MTSITDVTQAYLASSFADQAIKPPVRLAATVNVTPIGIGQTIDGAVTQLGDRVLLTAQTDARQNGIRVVSDGVWPVPGDFSNLVSGTLFTATAGVANAGQYSLTTANPIILGVTALTFMTSTVGGLAAETAARISADNTLQANINAEAVTRSAADATLQTNITAEASARASADTAITTNLAAASGSSLVSFTQSGTGAVTRPVQDKLRELFTSEDNPTIGIQNIGIGGFDTVSPIGKPIRNVTSGISNVGVGAGSLKSVTTGSGNQAFGDGALRNVTTGTENCGIAGGSFDAVTTGNNNVGLGGNSGAAVSTGSGNVAIGVDAMEGIPGSEVTGSNNLAVGTTALSVVTFGSSNNTALGVGALQTLSLGSGNVAIGLAAGKHATTNNEFYLDNQDRTTNAAEKANALVYGTFGANAAAQTYKVNGVLSGLGTITNDSAAVGQIGEYIESVVGATNFPTTAQFGDLTSISLTAGDWDVTLVVDATLNGATMTGATIGISTTTGNSGAGMVVGSSRVGLLPPTAATDNGACIANFRVSLNATVVYFAKFLATYSAGTPQASGRLSARRVR